MVSPAQSLRDQWKEPSDIFTVLLIIGGDIVQQALGAVSGGFLTPVAFSYGWVAYAVSALLSATGDGRLMPETPITNLRVINLKSGYCRWNRSWVLGRVFQDYEHWMPSAVRERLEEHPSQNSDEEKKVPGSLPGGRQPEVALCVAVYHWSTEGNSLARPGHDWVWWTGLLVSLIQIAISAVPFGIYGDWRVFLVTVSGTVLAYAAGALPGWRKEKWACRRGSGKDVALTLGNGTTHVVIVHGGHPDGLDLEDLAGAEVRHSGAATSNRRSISRMIESCNTTRLFIAFLAILWLVLLITSQAIESHTWYLVGVGGLGMIQNLIVAGAPRFPEMLGISIELSESSQGTPSVFAEYKVMYTLMELELGYKGFGRALLAEFFPGKLRDWEENWWALTNNEERRVILDEKKRGLQR